MASPVIDVFLSYKAEDRSRLNPLVGALEAEGFSVWWDNEIGGGTNWRDDIQAHLDAAKCVIVAWTKRSVGPNGTFVRDEATRAQKRGTYLPIRLDAIQPPLGFGEVQAISLKGWKGDRSDPQFRALVDAIRKRIPGDQRPSVTEPQTRRLAARGLGRRRWRRHACARRCRRLAIAQAGGGQRPAHRGASLRQPVGRRDPGLFRGRHCGGAALGADQARHAGDRPRLVRRGQGPRHQGRRRQAGRRQYPHRERSPVAHHDPNQCPAGRRRGRRRAMGRRATTGRRAMRSRSRRTSPRTWRRRSASPLAKRRARRWSLAVPPIPWRRIWCCKPGGPWKHPKAKATFAARSRWRKQRSPEIRAMPALMPQKRRCTVAYANATIPPVEVTKQLAQADAAARKAIALAPEWGVAYTIRSEAETARLDFASALASANRALSFPRRPCGGGVGGGGRGAVRQRRSRLAARRPCDCARSAPRRFVREQGIPVKLGTTASPGDRVGPQGPGARDRGRRGAHRDRRRFPASWGSCSSEGRI